PRFGHLRTPEIKSSHEDQGSSGRKVSIKDRLREAATMNEAKEAIIDGLAQKTRDILLIPRDQSVNPSVPLLDQGIDSLGAFAISAWFSQELLVDIPILLVLGGASLEDVAETAVKRLGRDAIPLIASEIEGYQSPTLNSEDSSLASDKSLVSSASSSVASYASGKDQASAKISRRNPLSLGQAYSWKLQKQLSHDHTIFHNTIAYLFEGYIDLKRLGTAVDQVLRRHEILRTAFLDDLEPHEGDSLQQVILETPTWGLICKEVANQAAAEEAMKQLHEEAYDLGSGRPFKLVDFYWSSGHRHLLTVAYHRLAGDGATTSLLMSEISASYDGAGLSVTVPQFAKIAIRQRADYEQGRLDADIAYWVSQYNNGAVPIMPVLNLPDCQLADRSNSPPVSWSQHKGVFRLSSAVSAEIREIVRQQKVSRMQFFMTVYATLLARLTNKMSSGEAEAISRDNGDDDASRMITIGVADTNRATMEDMAAMGFFANLLPVRIETRRKGDRSPFSPVDQLDIVKKAMREAMLHSRVPYGVLLERLPVTPSLQVSAKVWSHAPLFQAVFDYAGGGVESVRIGDAVMTEQGALQATKLISRERTPYDVVLEIWDDTTRDPLVIIKLQSSLYSSKDVTTFYDAFVELLSTYSTDLTGYGQMSDSGVFY
ncbi:CoA-dependent acyltransferase, partial [Colletotrichum sublineola]